ncbi:SAM-dependent methyltransferase [Streptosporangium sp. NPDC051022]|uniref:SAM-dependent methyltransferase n=1 Tax=Streptosporangium sp. NPDC051022 TaxID=3155752 RepID=UPI00341A0F4B
MSSPLDTGQTTDRPHLTDQSHADARAVEALLFTRPSAPRIDHHLLGGQAVYDLDRQAGNTLVRAVPGIRDMVRARRAFVTRCARRFAEEGLDQFLDLGCGLPTGHDVHHVVHAVDPAARVLYVDHDPIVLQHAWAHLSGPGVEVVTADVRDTRLLLAALHDEGMLDLRRPVAVLLAGVLDFVADHELPAVLTGLRKSLAPGSRLALTHLCADRLTTAEATALTEVHARTQTPLRPRGRTAIGALFTGFVLDEPGLVELYPWGPDEGVWPVANSFVLGGLATLRHPA